MENGSPSPMDGDDRKMTTPSILPGYTTAGIKPKLLAAGASGTIYAMVMPESEAGIQHVVDGCDLADVDWMADGGMSKLKRMRDQEWLSQFREPWTSRQDTSHVEWFDSWIRWTKPVVGFDPDAFPFRFPTAGASEGIYKVMSEYAARPVPRHATPSISVFHGEYEGFTSFAEGLNLPIARVDRDDLAETIRTLPHGTQFWISQPSAIDGMVWDGFNDFATRLAAERPDVQLVPDLSYVGAVARDYHIDLTSPSIDSFVVSHSKPFGGYYHRCGGVFSRVEWRSLFGNVWFKNLTSIAYGVEMMRRHGVQDLPRRYRETQERAARDIGERLGIQGLKAADVFMIGIAPMPDDPDPLVHALRRGAGSTRCVRVCLTPSMSAIVDRRFAPDIHDRFYGDDV
jgi:hypothetical protein